MTENTVSGGSQPPSHSAPVHRLYENFPCFTSQEPGLSEWKSEHGSPEAHSGQGPSPPDFLARAHPVCLDLGEYGVHSHGCTSTHSCHPPPPHTHTIAGVHIVHCSWLAVSPLYSGFLW